MKYYSVASLPRCFALAFSVTSLPWASRFVLERVSRIALTKIFDKNMCVSIDSKYSEMHRNAKKFNPFDSKRALRTATLPTLCQSQAPKECPCQVSCRLVQNCGCQRDTKTSRCRLHRNKYTHTQPHPYAIII